MNIEFKKSFARDLKKKAKDANLRLRVQEIIQQVDDADCMDEIRNFKKLRAEGNYYRIRLGVYRIFNNRRGYGLLCQAFAPQ